MFCRSVKNSSILRVTEFSVYIMCVFEHLFVQFHLYFYQERGSFYENNNRNKLCTFVINLIHTPYTGYVIHKYFLNFIRCIFYWCHDNCSQVEGEYELFRHEGDAHQHNYFYLRCLSNYNLTSSNVKLLPLLAIKLCFHYLFSVLINMHIMLLIYQ